MHIVVQMQSDADLAKIIRAGSKSGRLPRRLDRGQKQRDQDADNGNHHQQLDQGKTTFSTNHGALLGLARHLAAPEPPRPRGDGIAASSVQYRRSAGL